MATRENERRDSVLILLLILLFGFICILVASGWALRFAPRWRLVANMNSKLNPNSEFINSQPIDFIEPLDSNILTQPAWMDVFLTPGAVFFTRTPQPTSIPTLVFTPTPKTNTPAPTSTTAPTLVPTLPIIVPTRTRTPNPTSPPPPIASDTPVPPASADLQITKTDNATHYASGISVQYIITASNPSGPSGVIGATVTDTFPSNLDPASITWTCVGAGGGTCTANGTGNINDTFVNLPVGASVTYTVSATVITSPSPVGPLTNTATIFAPAGVTDPNPGNDSATDTDQLIVASSFPYGQLGTSPDGSSENIPAGINITLQFGTPLVVGSHVGYDLVYYPDPAAPTLQMDVVILQVGDGSNWYTILNWGDGIPDTNTDINPADCPLESDNCVITPPPTNLPGVSINLDGVVPNGTYYYIRIFSRANPPDSGDGVDIDAITILP